MRYLAVISASLNTTSLSLNRPQSRRTFKEALVIGAIFVLGQTLAALLFDLPKGPVLGGDSGRYLAGAERFPSLEPVDAAHVGYVALLRAGMVLGSPTWFVFTFQCAVVVVAAIVLKNTLSRLVGPAAGWIAVLIFLLHLPLSQWTRYVLTESLFYSGLIFVASGLLTIHSLGFSVLRLAYLVSATLFTISLRPNGVILLIGIGATLSIWFLDGWRSRLLGLAGSCLLFIVIVAVHPGLAQDMQGDQNALVVRLAAGEIFWKDGERAISMPDRNSSEIGARVLVSYVIQHPVAVARLGALRVLWEAAQVRPWYSTGLNIYLGITMAGFHLLAGLGAWKSRSSPLTLVVLALSLPSVAMIAVTWAVPDGRFGWWFLTLWIMWAAIGAQAVVDSISERKKIPLGRFTQITVPVNK
jgi:hypothetical protein